jgi:YVTN family beta-propeller protein
MPEIFISYRRGDSGGYAGRLCDQLQSEFGRSHVFMDVDAILPGVDFVKRIEDVVASTDILLVLIGPDWTSVKDAHGQARLDDPRDVVRLEIETALERGTAIIPVLLGQTDMPRSEQLPEPLARLTRWNAIDLSDDRWHYDVGRLVRAIKAVPHQHRASEGRRAPARESHGRIQAALSQLRSRRLPRFSLRKRRTQLLLAAAGLATIGVAAALLVSSGGAALSTTTIPTGKLPADIVWDREQNAVWVVNQNGQSLVRVDPNSNRRVGKAIPVGRAPFRLAVASGLIWVANGFAKTIIAVNPDTGKRAKPIKMRGDTFGLAAGEGYLWAADGFNDVVERIDTVHNMTAGAIPVGKGPFDLAVGRGSVWVANSRSGTVSKIDVNTRRVAARISVGRGVTGIAVGLGAVWAVNGHGALTKIDPVKNQAALPITVGKSADAIAIAGNSVWVASTFERTVTRIDPNGKTRDVLHLGRSPARLAASDEALWVADPRSNSIIRVDF